MDGSLGDWLTIMNPCSTTGATCFNATFFHSYNSFSAIIPPSTPLSVSITYNPSTKVTSYQVIGAFSASTTLNTDLVTLLGTSSVRFGFGGGTGLHTATFTISSFNYSYTTPTTPPPTTPPVTCPGFLPCPNSSCIAGRWVVFGDCDLSGASINLTATGSVTVKGTLTVSNNTRIDTSVNESGGTSTITVEG